MKKLLPSILSATDPSPKFEGWLGTSYLLKRKAGNILIAGGQPSKYLRELQAAGGVSKQLLNDRHFSSSQNEAIFDHFRAPISFHFHERKTVATRTKCKVGEMFRGPYKVGEDLEVIPTPGHAEGSLCFLFTPKGGRYLFVGDNFNLNSGAWDYWIVKKNIKKFIESLEMIRELKIDAILPSLAYKTETPFVEVTPKNKEKIFDSMLVRLRMGDIERVFK